MQAACGFEGVSAPPAVRFGAGALFLAAERAGVGSSHVCGVAVLSGKRWTVYPLPGGTRLNADAVLSSGSFVVGTVGVGTDAHALSYGSGGLFVYTAGRLVPVTIPTGQYVSSLLALPGGGYAAGTAPAGSAHPGASSGRLGVAAAHGGTRWYTPPASGTAKAFGMAPADPPYGVVVGAVQGNLLWFGVDGVGVAALNTATGHFQLHGSTYFPTAYGPIQFFPNVTSSSTVYYSIHRLPGIADAGYWGPLYAASAAGGGRVRRIFPATLPGSTPKRPDYGCIQGGVGAPSQVRQYGSRLWVKWSGCQVYEAIQGAPGLQRPAITCGQTGVWQVDVVFAPGASVSELCETRGAYVLYTLNGRTGAVEATHVWKTAPWKTAKGRGIPWAGWFAAPGGGLWAWSSKLYEVAPTGVITAHYAFAGPLGAVLGARHLWLVGTHGVAAVPATAAP